MWRQFESKLLKIYHKKVFWTGAYFVASCGGVTIEQLKEYVQKPRASPLVKYLSLLLAIHEGCGRNLRPPNISPRPIAGSEGLLARLR